jgi:hypothetical protein
LAAQAANPFLFQPACWRVSAWRCSAACVMADKVPRVLITSGFSVTSIKRDAIVHVRMPQNSCQGFAADGLCLAP